MCRGLWQSPIPVERPVEAGWRSRFYRIPQVSGSEWGLLRVCVDKLAVEGMLEKYQAAIIGGRRRSNPRVSILCSFVKPDQGSPRDRNIPNWHRGLLDFKCMSYKQNLPTAALSSP